MAHSTLSKSSPRKTAPVTFPTGPRTATINAILNYSKALKVVEVPPVGKIELVLN
jgi:hypothetical protein